MNFNSKAIFYTVVAFYSFQDTVPIFLFFFQKERWVFLSERGEVYFKRYLFYKQTAGWWGIYYERNMNEWWYRNVQFYL